MKGLFLLMWVTLEWPPFTSPHKWLKALLHLHKENLRSNLSMQATHRNLAESNF